jgi:sugar phosphate isomerase/epimerase
MSQLTRLTRRDFVGLAAAAGCALAARRTEGAGVAQTSAGAPAEASAKAGPRLILGLASYSVREFPLDQALTWAKELGVTHMTFKDVHLPRTDPLEKTRELAAKIRAAGITIMGGGTITLPNDQTQIRKDFDYAKAAGFPLIYVDPDPAALDFVEEMAKQYDIRVAIHNHGPEEKDWPTPKSAYDAVKSRDKRLGLCIDIGHTLRTGTDPVKACRDCRDRLYDMHVKDLRVRTDRDSQVAVGRGVIDFPGLFRTLIDIGYRGQVGLEYEINAKNPMPGIIESMAYMRGVLAALTT